MKPQCPSPQKVHPIDGVEQICYIKNSVKNPYIEIGDYTYYDDPDGSENFEKNVLYHFDFIGDKLKIGKFCAIAKGVQFIMNGAQHRTDTFSSYPFAIFCEQWSEKLRHQPVGAPPKGDTIIGNDVWLGRDATIMSGIHIGDGAIVAAKSVVVSDIPPYTVYGGNPAKFIKKRFSDEMIACLLKLQWWHWDIEKITENIDIIFSHDGSKLQKLCQDMDEVSILE